MFYKEENGKKSIETDYDLTDVQVDEDVGEEDEACDHSIV